MAHNVPECFALRYFPIGHWISNRMLGAARPARRQQKSDDIEMAVFQYLPIQLNILLTQKIAKIVQPTHADVWNMRIDSRCIEHVRSIRSSH